MQLLFLSGREIDYPRNALLLRVLEQFGEVEKVDEKNWPKSIIRRSLRVFFRALPGILSRKYDLIIVGFYGHLLMLPLGLLSRPPLLFDAYLSTYDTLCFDRKVFSPHSLPGWLAYQLDRLSCASAAHVLLDTSAQKKYFETTFSIPSKKIEPVFVGCDERVFFPRIDVPEIPIVLFYGSYLPLHGVDIIVRAARLLRDEIPLRFHLIGSGFTFGAVRRLANELQATNIDFLPSVPMETLPDYIGRAMICLGGHFGATDKARRVIAGKTFQCLAMAKPVIVGNNPANRELLTHGQDAWFCEMNDPQSLAESIRTLFTDERLRSAISQEAYKSFEKKASFPVLTRQIQKIVSQITT